MEANQGRLGSQRGQQFGTGTQWGVPHCISTYWHPPRWTGNASGVPSPCERTGGPLETGLDTHTHTHPPTVLPLDCIYTKLTQANHQSKKPRDWMFIHQDSSLLIHL